MSTFDNERSRRLPPSVFEFFNFAFAETFPVGGVTKAKVSGLESAEQFLA